MNDPAPDHPPGARPLVYSCSGCSSAAQLANHVAVQLDRRGVARRVVDRRGHARVVDGVRSFSI